MGLDPLIPLGWEGFMVWMLWVGYPANPITFCFLHVENGCRCKKLEVGDVAPVIPVVRSDHTCAICFFFVGAFCWRRFLLGSLVVIILRVLGLVPHQDVFA